MIYPKRQYYKGHWYEQTRYYAMKRLQAIYLKKGLTKESKIDYPQIFNYIFID